MTVSIVEMTSGITSWQWLCAECIARRRAAGWSVKMPEPMPEGTPCADCELARQAAPGYVTPTVVFVTTGADSHLPTREEVARMPGSKPMTPWSPAPKAKSPSKRNLEAA